MMLRIKLNLRTELWIALSVKYLTLNKAMSKRHEIEPEIRLSSFQKEGSNQQR